jgi:4-hydroxy-3-polyprenylbenzoate decarboxylase
MKVHKVYAKKNAIWPFTVVGRPPQEDTAFGALIHEISGSAIPHEIPGVKEVHAVDAAGVHPLLLAVGSERYTPYLKERKPQEILTIANHILGKNQLSLAKYLFIAAKEDAPELDIHDLEAFLQHVLERIDLTRDIHFYTKTTIDTLDYSGDGLNTGSKLVLAAVGKPRRNLGQELPVGIELPEGFSNLQLAMPGVLCVQGPKYTSKELAEQQMHQLTDSLPVELQERFPWISVCDDSSFVAANLANWLWVTFTRSNPSHDVYGVNSSTQYKHWGCAGSLVVDARIKPHHAPAVEMPEAMKQLAKDRYHG